MEAGKNKRTQTFTGVGVSRGIAIGRAYIVKRRSVSIPKRKIDPSQVFAEVERFKLALEESHKQLETLREKVPDAIEEPGDILAAHQLMLSDDLLVQGTLRRIQDDEINAEWALSKTIEHVTEVFDHVDDPYFKERRSDVEFVGERVLRNLIGEGDLMVSPPADAIAVARFLSPADAVQLHKAAVSGLVTETGGVTSHTALVARAFEIPAIVGASDITDHVSSGDLLIIDGKNGLAIVEPELEIINEYRDKARKLAAAEQELLQDKNLPAETTDGVRIELHANIELPEEIPSVLDHGAEGVGLYRTEYLYLSRDTLPSEEELLSSFRKVLRLIGNNPVTFRTFDLGGDKAAAFFKRKQETNPALGLRSTRLALKEPDAFRTHLRALLRSVDGERLQVMFPMISDLSELRAAKQVLFDVRDELSEAGEPIPRELIIGTMVEMPSAAVLSDLLALECDFFSVGSNDLIQYTLAIDRVNEQVAYLYHPLHPAILKLLKRIVDNGHENGIKVSICGAMAGEPMLSVVLVGLGLDSLSMPCVSIPLVKKVIRRTSYEKAVSLVESLLQMETVEEIEDTVMQFMCVNYKEIIMETKHRDLFSWRLPPSGLT